MPVHAVAVKHDSNHIDDTFDKSSRIKDAEGIYSLMGKLPKDFQDRWIWIACRKAGWKGPKPTVAEMSTALRDDAEPERAKWFERAFAGFKGKALKTGKGLTRAADEHADRVADWMEAQRVKAALRDVAVAAADFARAVMPCDSHTAHPDRLGCRLMTASNEAIRLHARSLAAEEAEIIAAMNVAECPKTAEQIVEDLKWTCEKWQRRRLRRLTADARQYWAAALGMASKRGAAYCNRYSLERWRERQADNRLFAEITELIHPVNGRKSLAAVMEANQKARAAQLYAFSLALQEIGDRAGLVPVFLTLTLPPEMHWHPTTGFENRKWNPTYTPQYAAVTLQVLWEQLRALFAKEGVRLLGIWCKEPHGDGCPHQHALLYVEPEKVEAVRRCVKAKYPGIIKRRKGKDIEQGQVIVFDRAKETFVDSEGNERKAASPASYIMKYLLKSTSIDAEHLPEQARERMDDGKLEAIRAQRSELRLRGYGFLGLHGVLKIAQKVYTATEDAAERFPVRARNARDIMKAADKDPTRWADALIEMGAIRWMGEGGRLAGMYESYVNAYGEESRRWIGFQDKDSGEEADLREWGWETDPESMWKVCPRTKRIIRNMVQVQIGWTMETAPKKANDDDDSSTVTLVDSSPRGEADASPVIHDFDGWRAEMTARRGKKGLAASAAAPPPRH